MSSALRIRRSVFERLLDDDSDVPEGLMQTQTIEQLRDSVAQDLERLLNARSAINFDELTLGIHAARSVLCFGVRDFVGRVLSSSEDRRHISRSLSNAIETQEPRLKDVAVEFHDEAPSKSSLAFTIRATLVVRPTRESVSFDAVLQPSLCSYQVTQARFSYA